ELRKGSHVRSIVEKFSELSLKVVVARNVVENAFLTFPDRTRPRKGLATEENTGGFDQFVDFLFDGQRLKSLLEYIHAYIVRNSRTHGLNGRVIVNINRVAQSFLFEELS